MKFEQTDIDGAFIIEHDVQKDARGAFVKTFHKEEFSQMGLEWDFRESYYTRSKEDVIRGMHLQVPPYDHAKLVTIIHGTVVDVILDLRRSSPTFRQHVAVELSRENRKSIYIPRGCAHGPWLRSVGRKRNCFLLGNVRACTSVRQGYTIR